MTAVSASQAATNCPTQKERPNSLLETHEDLSGCGILTGTGVPGSRGLEARGRSIVLPAERRDGRDRF